MHTPRIRRPKLSFANVTSVFALLIATTMGGAYAHGMIGSSEIKNNAVKSRHIGAKQVKTGDLAGGAVATAKIKTKAVNLAKLAPANRPAHVTQFRFGAHDFVAESNLLLRLPGVTQAQLQNSHWECAVVGTSGTAPTIPVSIPLAFGDSAEGPVCLPLFIPAGAAPGVASGAVMQIADNTDIFDGVNVTGIRVSQTQRPTATKNATKLVIPPRAAGRLRLP